VAAGASETRAKIRVHRHERGDEGTAAKRRERVAPRKITAAARRHVIDNHAWARRLDADLLGGQADDARIGVTAITVVAMNARENAVVGFEPCTDYRRDHHPQCQRESETHDDDSLS
jgi:hypothetical protein